MWKIAFNSPSKPTYQRDLEASLASGAVDGELIWRGRRGRQHERWDPKDIYGVQHEWSQGQNPVRLNDRFLAILPEAVIHTREGFVQLNNGRFLIEPAWNTSFMEGTGFLNRRSRFLVRRYRGNWFSLPMYWSWGYFHWFCDVLPRLHQILDKLPDDTRFLIQDNPPSWMLDSLSIFGINRERCVSLSHRFPVQLERLYYCPPVGMTNDHDPEAVGWVRETFQKVLPAPPKRTDRRLYVSRHKALCRKIINEEAFFESLRPLGFERVLAEDMSLREQIELFASASVLIGPHGAGFTNMLFMPEGSTILECFEPRTLRRCYGTLSAACGHAYYAVVGETVENKDRDNDIIMPAVIADQIASVLSGS